MSGVTRRINAVSGLELRRCVSNLLRSLSTELEGVSGC